MCCGCVLLLQHVYQRAQTALRDSCRRWATATPLLLEPGAPKTKVVVLGSGDDPPLSSTMVLSSNHA